MKLQLSLDYMIAFSFVIIIFLIVFATIANQRVLATQQQEFLNLQFVAQNIAAQLTAASQAGTGYSSVYAFPTSVGLVNYNLTITKNGVVVVSSNVLGRVIQGVAVGLVKNVVSSNSFITSRNSNAYNISITNGTISFLNNFGTICIDSGCATSTNQAYAINLTTGVTHAAAFSSSNVPAVASYINTGNGISTATPNSFSVSMWVKFNNATSLPQQLINDGGVWSIEWGNVANTLMFHVNIGLNGQSSSLGSAFYTFYPVSGQWYNIVGVYANSVTTNAILYINGGVVNSAAGVTRGSSQTNNMIIGADYTVPGNEAFNGSMANLQVYNSILTQALVSKIYAAGIAGAPPANSVNSLLAGYWPLNGDFKDYSGNANNGVSHGAIIFTTVAQLFTKVVNSTAAPVSGVLVGYETTLGSFDNNTDAISNYTNANGIATAFLNQGGNNGYAVVKTMALEGNSTLSANLIGWWPMNLGQGNIIPDTSGRGHGAYMINVSWSNPNYVASFDGRTSNMTANVVWSASSSISACVWVNELYAPSGNILSYAPVWTPGGSTGMITINPTNIVWAAAGGFGTAAVANIILPTKTWTNICGVYSAGGSNIYVNGIYRGSAAANGARTVSNIELGDGNNLYINGYYTNYFFPGYMANMQLYNGVLTNAQVLTLYNQGISAPPMNAVNAIGWWPLDGDAGDYSAYLNNGTIHGRMSFAPFTLPSNQTSYNFLTATFNSATKRYSYISFNNLALNSQAAAGASTATFWMNWSGTANVMVLNFTGSNNQQDYSFYIPTASCMGISDTSTNAYGVNGMSLAGAWHFVVAVFQSGVAYPTNDVMYIDGVKQTMTQCYGAASGTGYVTSNFILGAAAHASKSYFSNSISNLQLYNGTLTQAQVTQLYNGGLGAFPLQNTNLVGWWPLNGNANDYGPFNYNGYPTNVIYSNYNVTNPSLVGSVSGYGINMNGGLNSYTMTFANSPMVVNQITVVAWAKQNGFSAAHYAYSLAFGTGLNSGFSYLAGTQQVLFSVENVVTTEAIIVGPNEPLGKWIQYVGTWDGNTMRLYINGVQYGTTASLGGRVAVLGASLGGIRNWIAMNGSVADIEEYNISMSAKQVTQLYNSKLPQSQSVVIPVSWIP